MKKVAIIGSGIAGMSAGYFLREDYEVTLFEKNNYYGGHTNTVYVEENQEQKPIDSGFIVFNEVTYPHLIKLFKELKVPYYDSDMSFSVLEDKSGLEYNGSSFWNGLFAQKKNFLNPTYWKMIFDIQKLCKLAPQIVSDPHYDDLTVRNLVDSEGFGENFLNHFLIPMSSAVWSTPTEKMLDFPAKSLVRFFLNHGFLGLDTQHQWKTVKNGSDTYKKKILKFIPHKVLEAVKKVELKEENGITKAIVQTSQKTYEHFDFVIFASHADETLQLLHHPSELQKKLLSPFKYQKSIALLHTDASVMPRLKKNWSSWNFIYRDDESFTVYYMNRLQEISASKNYFININGEKFVDPSTILKRIIYDHPVFDQHTLKAQSQLQELNNDQTPFYFCGSYFRYGFHEDALLSSVTLCEKILKRPVFKETVSNGEV